MKTHYYFSWFNNFFPEKLVKLLHEDLTDRKSLVMLSASGNKEEQGNNDSVFERTWFNQANIIFDEYHLIDYRMQKEDAHRFIQNASVIFLCGGDPDFQRDFLVEYELSDVIKNSNAVILGASAGALNMAGKWLSLIESDNEVEISTIYDGIGLVLIILPMNLILNATTTSLLKATCSPCPKTLMFMPLNRRALYV